MNMLLLDKNDFISADTVSISGRRFIRLKDFIHIEPGKQLKAGLRNENCGSAEVIGIEKDQVTLRYRAETAPPSPPQLTLLIALQRPQTFSKVIHSAVTLGIKKIHFIHTFKVEKSYWQGSRLQKEYIENELLLALEQCADTIMPEIHFHPRFKPFIEDELPDISPGAARIAGIPGASAVPEHYAGRPVLLAVGPEGGFTDFENQFLLDHGFTGVGLGPHILRTEFAVAALLARLSVSI